jgi:hypothetical protein
MGATAAVSFGSEEAGTGTGAEADGRELRMPILRHLLRDRDGLDESRVGGLPVSLNAHVFALPDD